MYRHEIFALAQTRKGERKGQAVFNTLAEVFPDEARALAGTDVDCYSDDSKIDAFLTALGVE